MFDPPLGAIQGLLRIKKRHIGCKNSLFRVEFEGKMVDFVIEMHASSAGHVDLGTLLQSLLMRSAAAAVWRLFKGIRAEETSF